MTTETAALSAAKPYQAGDALIAALSVAIIALLWFVPVDLSPGGRMTLIITALAVTGWVATKIPESVVALVAALALVLSGAVPQSRLFETLGSDLVWLLLAAFVIAAVVRESGLTDRLVAPLTRRQPAFALLVALLTPAIAATAFLLPSTSGRAALLLPVFLALLPSLPDPRMRHALALLFPTVILLSAGASLIGAGAHLVAVEAIAGAGGPRISYLDWLLIGAPLGLAASAVGAMLIVLLFVPRALWLSPVRSLAPPIATNPRQRRVAGLVLALLALWLSEPLHGLDMTIVAVAGAVALLTRPFTATRSKEIFRAVDVELILYMAATMLMAQAMIDNGADRWLAGKALATLPAAVVANGTAMVIALSVIAVTAHLFITSRSARAAVLIPAIALPVAGLGYDATLMILITVMGTGFCQTMMASAKPVAIFGLREEAGFSQGDLFRLAIWLAPAKTLLLAGFALLVWPAQIAGLQAPVEAPAPKIAGYHVQLPPALPAQTTIASPPATSILPQPRPTQPRATVAPVKAEPAKSAPTRPSRKATKPVRRQPDFVTRFRRDVRAAQQQIQRDLNRLLR